MGAMELREVAQELGGRIKELRVWCNGGYYTVNEVRFDCEQSDSFGERDPIQRRDQTLTFVAANQMPAD